MSRPPFLKSFVCSITDFNFGHEKSHSQCSLSLDEIFPAKKTDGHHSNLIDKKYYDSHENRIRIHFCQFKLQHRFSELNDCGEEKHENVEDKYFENIEKCVKLRNFPRVSIKLY